MDIKHIPKYFWYSISFSLFIISIGFSVVVYKSNSISIEFANTKINFDTQNPTNNLNNTLLETKKAKLTNNPPPKELYNSSEIAKELFRIQERKGLIICNFPSKSNYLKHYI